MTYAQLNLAQRYHIQRRLAAAQPVVVIARALGVHLQSFQSFVQSFAVKSFILPHKPRLNG